MVPFPSPTAQQKLKTLSALFNSLPDTLPTDSEPSTHQFTLDPEDIDDISYPGALNKLFHHVWGYRASGISITSRGSKLDATLAVLQYTLSQTDDLTVHLWVDSLCEAAKAAGAPPTFQPPNLKSPIQSTPKKSPKPAKPQKDFSQSKLPFQVLNDEDKIEHEERVRVEMGRRNEEAELMRDECALTPEWEKRQKEDAAREARRIKQACYRARLKMERGVVIFDSPGRTKAMSPTGCSSDVEIIQMPDDSPPEPTETDTMVVSVRILPICNFPDQI